MNARDPIASPMHMQYVEIQAIIKYPIKISSYMNVYYYSIYSKPEENKIDYRTFKTIVPT